MLPVAKDRFNTSIHIQLSNIDVQSMFRNADYVLQEINSLTEVGLGITDHSQRSTPLHSRPGSPRFGGLPVRSSPRIEAPPLIVVEDIDLPEPEEESEGLSIAAVENLYANVDRLELEMRAVEAQRNNLETLLAEKNKQLARAEAKAVAMHRAYCNLVDYVNAIIDEDVGEIMKDLAEVSASFEIAPIFPKVPAPVVATELAAPQRATMKTISADPIISTPSVPVVTLSNGHTISAPIPVSPDALPMTKPGSIFGPAKLGSGSNSTSSSQANGSSKTTSSFHFRSPLQLLSKEKETDSGLGNFFFGKSNRSKSLSSSSASSSTSKNVLPIPAPNATAAQATTNQEPKIVQPTGSSSSLLSDQPPVLTLDGEEYVERRKKKRQAPILLEYSGEAATMREASNGDAETESVLRDGTRNTSSRKAADSSAVSLVDSLDWSVSDTSMILGSPSEIFAAVGLAPEMEVMDNKQSQLLQPQPPVVEAAPTPVVMAPYLPRSVATVATPSTDSPSSPLIEAPPTSPTSPVTPLDTVRSKRSREPLLPANSNPAYGIAPNMILEARQKLVPVQKTRAAGYPVPAGERSTAVSDVKAAIERLNENKAESKPSPRSGPVKQESGASVAELRSAFSGVTSTSGGAAAKDGVPKKKRTVRKVPRADFGDLYAFSNAMAEDGSEVHGSTPLDQVRNAGFSADERFADLDNPRRHRFPFADSRTCKS